MIVSATVHEWKSQGEDRRSSRCSQDVLNVETTSSGVSTANSSSTQAASVALPSSLSLSVSPSSSVAETFDEADALSSPASSGYGRSATSELEDFEPLHRPFQPSKGLRRSGRKSSEVGEAASRSSSLQSSSTLLASQPPRHPLVSKLGRLVSEEDVEVIQELGEGFFSVVHMVRLVSTGEVLVRKVAKPGVRKQEKYPRRATHADVAREAAMLLRLRHENVLALRALCISPGFSDGWDMHLLVDYCSGGSLSRLLLDHSCALSWRRRLVYAVGIARGMQHIHACRVIHRDLTSMNILIQNESATNWGRAVIADFGLSCDFPRAAQKLCQVGTPYFMSPECLKDQYYDEKSDVFSFGIILCQMIARIEADPDFGLHRTQNFGLNYVLFNSYCPPDTPMGLLKLAFSCCLMDPQSRPSFPYILPDLLQLLDLCSAPMDSHSPSRQPSLHHHQQGIGSPARLERSRSDAALRQQQNPRGPVGRKRSVYKRQPSTVIEGIPHEPVEPSRFSRDESRRVSARMLTMSPALRTDMPQGMNPFASHARFASERKIVPSRDSRRSSETKRDEEDEENENCEGGRGDIEAEDNRGRARQIRRCSSLPKMDGDDLVLSEEEGSEGAMERGAAGGTTAAAGPAAIPIAFREYDQKFLRQSRRFSRRALSSLLPASSAAANALSSLSATSNITPPSSPPRESSSGAASNLSPVKKEDDEAAIVTGLKKARKEKTSTVVIASQQDVSMAPTRYGSWPKRKDSLVRSDGGLRASICVRGSSRRQHAGEQSSSTKGCTIL